MLRMLIVGKLDHIVIFGAEQVAQILHAPRSLVQKKSYAVEVASHETHHRIGPLRCKRRCRYDRAPKERQSWHREDAKAVAFRVSRLRGGKNGCVDTAFLQCNETRLPDLDDRHVFVR